MSGMITMGAKSRVGEASLVVAVIAAIPGLMMFDWIYWWAGRRWGKRAIDFFLGNHPRPRSGPRGWSGIRTASAGWRS